MIVDNFDNELKIDKFLMSVPLIGGIILFVIFLLFGIYNLSLRMSASVLFYSAVITLTIPLMLGVVFMSAGFIFTIILKQKAKSLAKIYVDTKQLYFALNGEIYYFDELIPEFDVTKSKNTLFVSMYDFVLHFKNGTSLEFTLLQSTALSFIRKYLTKYSKPSVSPKICGIKF